MELKYEPGNKVLIEGEVRSIVVDATKAVLYQVTVPGANNLAITEKEIYDLKKENVEKVDHPFHYNLPGKKECIEQMREDYGDTITAIFCLTNAYKYLYRAGSKEGESRKDDLDKAFWYFNYQEHVLDFDLVPDIFELYDKVRKELEKYE